MSCQRWFKAFDGWQRCGRPEGHKGAHTRDLLPFDPGYKGLREHRQERERRERESRDHAGPLSGGPDAGARRPGQAEEDSA